MARRGESRAVEAAFGRKRLAAAEAFLDQAQQSEATAASEYDRAAAMSSAILAAIAAADAACALRLGEVWKSDHGQAHTLLRKVRGAEKAAVALQRIVGAKSAVQYMADSVTEAKLATAIRQAKTVLDFATTVAASP